MADDVAIEARVPPELDEALGRLALARGISKPELVKEALADFVLGEAAFAAAVEEGRAAARAGDLIDHDDVMCEIDELLLRK